MFENLFYQVYYSLSSTSGLCNSQRHTDQSIQGNLKNHAFNKCVSNKDLDLASWFTCPRSNLNICASPKGVIGGCIQFQVITDSFLNTSLTLSNQYEGNVIDGTKLISGWLITEKHAQSILTDPQTVQINARYLLIIEKEAIFVSSSKFFLQ